MFSIVLEFVHYFIFNGFEICVLLDKSLKIYGIFRNNIILVLCLVKFENLRNITQQQNTRLMFSIGWEFVHYLIFIGELWKISHFYNTRLMFSLV